MTMLEQAHPGARRRFQAAPVLLLLSLSSACAPARADGAGLAKPPADAALLGWMEGRWTGSQDGIDMEEHWTSSTGSALLGMHKDVKGGRMTSFEFLRIEPTSKDGLVFFASPRSAPVTPFVLVELADKRAVFENKDHDFPQRVLYWLDAAGALHARIEGTMKGSPQSEEWTWKKR